MAKPKRLIKASEDLVVNTILAATAISSGVSLWTGDGWFPQALKIGFLAASTFGLIKYNFWTHSTYNPMPRRAMAAMESSIRQIPSSDPDIKSYLYRWKPDKPEYRPKFIFRSDILFVPVHEDELRAFMKTAVLRQNNALYGGRAWRIRNNDGEFRRIKINWVLSENYFTRHHRPRYPLDLYQSIMIILAVSHLRRCANRNGKSDYLIGDWGVEGYVEQAIQRWLKYTAPTTSANRPSFLRRLVS